jgi:hypothetical protein
LKIWGYQLQKQIVAAIALLLLTLIFLAGCSGRGVDAAESEANLRRALDEAEFREAQKAGRELLFEHSAFKDGSGIQEVTALLGEPDHEERDKSSTDIYYKTAGGPMYLVYQDNKLIKKCMLEPAHWLGTYDELAELWSRIKDGERWTNWGR